MIEIKEWLSPVVVGAYPTETVASVAQRMKQYGIGSVIVNSPDQKPVGIVTERDVLNKIVADGADPNKITVGEIMTSPIETVNASSPPFEIFNLFAERSFRHLPVTLDDGRIIGVLSLRSKGFIQEICRLMQILQNVNELKSRFLSNVSHDLKTPLISMTRGASMILDNYETMKKEEVIKFLKIIEGQGNRLVKMLADLLDMTALEAGKMRIEKRLVDVRRVIDIAIKNSELLAKRKDVRLSIGDLSKTSTMFADDSRIMQVMENLISNAIKFTPAGGEIIISVKDEKEKSDKNSICIAVKDTGVGIPKEKIRMIFDRFQRAHDPNIGKEDGAGLGLSIVKEIVSLHNGDVWVESEENKGSTFYFTIPTTDVIYS